MGIPVLRPGSSGGLKDLRARRIRMTTKTVFREDPLRLLRAFSLRASLNFLIEPLTLAQIKKERALIRYVSRERVREEVLKYWKVPYRFSDQSPG